MTTVQPEAPTASPATDEQREDADDNPQYLPALRVECERLGFALQLTDDPDMDLPEVLLVDGQPTCLVRADELGVALDEVRAIGRCIDCCRDLDDTAGVYADGYHQMDGSPLMICQPCRDKRAAQANEPSNLAFTRALNAIEAAFKASKNTEQTRKALQTFVAMTADETKATV